MSTFNELINKVEKSNHELVKIRDTIETESIDLGSSIIDAMRELYVADQLTSPTSTSIDDLEGIEQGREDKKLRQDQITVLNKISDTIDKIYSFMLDGAPDENPLDGMVPPVVPLPMGRGGKAPRGGAPGGLLGQMRGFFSRVFTRLLKGGVVALIANELLNFFGLTTDDVVNYLATEIRKFEFPDLSELTLTDITEKVDRFVIDSADFIFGKEGTLESALEKAGIGAAIGASLFGPKGAVVGAMVGAIAGWVTSEEFLELKDQFFGGLGDTISAFWQTIFGDFGNEAAKVNYNSLKNNLQSKVLEGSVVETSPGVFELTERGRTRDPEAKYLLDEYNKIGGSEGEASAVLNQVQERLRKEIEELNQAGMKLDELEGYALQVAADRKKLDPLEFQDRYGISMGMQRKFANKISDDLQVARQELEQEQEDVMTQRQIEQAATIRYQDTSSSDNSINIQYIQASKYELSSKR